MDNAREQRGLMIAAKMPIRRNGNTNEWIVPSQSKLGVNYRVKMVGKIIKCTCPDFETRQETCKHGFAVEFVVQRESSVWGLRDAPRVTETVRVTYRQEWSAYNAAQMNEKTIAADLLRGLCGGIQQPQQKRGRPRLPLSDVTFAAIMKVFTTMSGRRATSDIRECHAKGQIAETPHYNSIVNYLENPALTPILKMLVEESAAPLKAIETNFAVDSSGFSTCVFERWYNEKYGRTKGGRKWVKTHLMCGVLTNVITSVEVTGPEVGDSGQLPALLERTTRTFSVSEVSADKGYASKANHEVISAAGATPFIAFKAGSIANNGSKTWEKMFHYFQFRKDDFLAHYHRRSNVESTFSMMKRKFGASIRSKTPVAQVNEVLCKVICHNLSVLVHAIFEFGIDPTFWADSPDAQ